MIFGCPGMATGMAIMGFGGGAFIASPLSVWLMSRFSTPTHVGVAETFIVMGAIYFVFMMVGAFIVRVPAPGWKPKASAPVQASKLITMSDVYVYDVLKTAILVDPGGAVYQRNGRHRGARTGFGNESVMFPGKVSAVAAAGFVGLISLFNMVGRFFWASTSDYIGRKNTYFVFMVLGLSCIAPCRILDRSAVSWRSYYAFSIISMYGGGFATVPAYLKDMFGTRYVGAIHGLLMTAWSMAGVLARCW